MSKSKKNVIDPEKIINNYGADSVRLFILSDSPPEKDVQWSEQGMISSYKFIQKLWLIHGEIKEKINVKNFDEKLDNELNIFTNKLIKKITLNLDKFNYNVIIANMYETYNFLVSHLKGERSGKTLLENYKKIIICFTPIIPHFCNEVLEDLKLNKDVVWPKFDEKLIKDDQINFVVQINGKKRTMFKAQKDINENSLMEDLKSNKILEKYLNNKEVKRVIFVKNRLINLLINE